MVIKNVTLETVCGITSTFPENTRYEVAFAGKQHWKTGGETGNCRSKGALN